MGPKVSDVNYGWTGWGIHILMALKEVQEEGGEVTAEEVVH